MLRSDVAKGDSGSYAVFTDQGSSASQVTAAKVLDVIARLPGCEGRASDAVSVKMENAPTLLKLPKSERPEVWIRPPRSKWPKDWQNIEEPVVPLEKEFVRTPPCRIALGESSKRFYSKMDGRKQPPTRMCRTSSRRSISVHPSQNGRRSDIAETSLVIPLERNPYDHPHARLLWEVRKSLVNEWMGASASLGVLFCAQANGTLFYPCTWMTST